MNKTFRKFPAISESSLSVKEPRPFLTIATLSIIHLNSLQVAFWATVQVTLVYKSLIDQFYSSPSIIPDSICGVCCQKCRVFPAPSLLYVTTTHFFLISSHFCNIAQIVSCETTTSPPLGINNPTAPGAHH